MAGRPVTWPRPSSRLGDRSLYRGLLRILPFDFRSEFGDDMEETFREQRAATARGAARPRLLRMWWATIRDIVAHGAARARQRAGAGHALRAAHDAQESRVTRWRRCSSWASASA